MAKYSHLHPLTSEALDELVKMYRRDIRQKSQQQNDVNELVGREAVHDLIEAELKPTSA